MASDTPTIPAPLPVDACPDGGFWRLSHKHLTAVLARRDLKGEQLRVYLALADLTLGYGRQRDAVSLEAIGSRAGGLRRHHVVRALHGLAAKGLYGQAPTRGQGVIRWVIWPAPVPGVGNTSTLTPVPGTGNTTVPGTGNVTVPGAGNLQEGRRRKKGKKTRAAAPPNPEVKVFIDWFSETFKTKLGRAYIVCGGKDGQLVKTMLAKLGDGGLEKLKAAATRMLCDDWGGPRADIGLLSSRLNQWLNDAPAPKRGGKHIPATTADDYADVVQRFDTPAGEDKQP